jgi:hypothetical protein
VAERMINLSSGRAHAEGFFPHANVRATGIWSTLPEPKHKMSKTTPCTVADDSPINDLRGRQSRLTRRAKQEHDVIIADWELLCCVQAPSGLKRDEIGMNRHRALGYCLSMIFSENRCTLFRIML